MATTLGRRGSRFRTHRPVGTQEAVRPRAVSISLGMVGVVTVVISAWGAIIPYVGPSFGYSADGAGSWHWSLTHSVLALVPGAIGVLVGLSFFAPVRATKVGRRKFSLGTAGLIAVACGAWFVIGPLAWPVIDNVGRYFVPAAPLRDLANQVGYALGPGLILAACGAFAVGWATRHNRPLDALGAASKDEAMVTDAPIVGPQDNASPVPGAQTAPVNQGQPGARTTWSTGPTNDDGDSVGQGLSDEPSG